MSLPPQGVVVVWDWEWLDDKFDYISETSSEGIAAINPSMESCSDADQSSKECSLNSPSATHTVTFKCIGTTHNSVSQQVLQKISDLLHQGDTVPVDIFPEPDNPYDSKAITFKCFLDGWWKRIGYIVREALASVHATGRLLELHFLGQNIWSHGPDLDQDIMPALTYQFMECGHWQLSVVPAVDRLDT